jgi:hypothetical protein
MIAGTFVASYDLRNGLMFPTCFEEQKMRIKLTVLGGALSALSVMAFSGGAFAAPCTTALATTYLAGGANVGCTVTDKTITNFNWPTAGAVPASAVTVIPIAVVGNPGLMFTSSAFATAGTDVVLNPNFTITAPIAGEITDAALTLTCNGTCTGRFVDTESFQVGSVIVGRTLVAGIDPGSGLNRLTDSETFATANQSYCI